MVNAFIYMFFVGSGTAAGVAAVALISWKIWQRMNTKKIKKQQRKGVSF